MPLVNNSYPFSSICSEPAKCVIDFPFLSCYVQLLLFFFLGSSEHVNKFAKTLFLFQHTGNILLEKCRTYWSGYLNDSVGLHCCNMLWYEVFFKYHSYCEYGVCLSSIYDKGLQPCKILKRILSMLCRGNPVAFEAASKVLIGLVKK